MPIFYAIDLSKLISTYPENFQVPPAVLYAQNVCAYKNLWVLPIQVAPFEVARGSFHAYVNKVPPPPS